jgi:hypothetical protein
MVMSENATAGVIGGNERGVVRDVVQTLTSTAIGAAQSGGVEIGLTLSCANVRNSAENRGEMGFAAEQVGANFNELDENVLSNQGDSRRKSATEMDTNLAPIDPRWGLLGVGHLPQPGLPSKRGPYVLTAEVAEQLYILLSAGFSRRQAAALLSISPSTISHAAARDAELGQRLRQAEELCALQPELTVMAEARKNWRAAAWYLQYRQKTPRPLTQEEKEEQHREKLADIERKAIESQAFFDGRQNAERRRAQGETPAQAAARRARQVAGLEVDDALPKREEVGRKRRGR